MPSPPATTSPRSLATAHGCTRRSQHRLRLAILDQDSGFVTVLLKRLQSAGWDSSLAPAGISAKRLADLPIDVLIVDLAAVGSKRLAWLGAICRLRPDLSVVVCSRPASVSQRVVSLRLGADDWLTKPCHPEELIARVESITGQTRRRRRRIRNLDPIVVGELEIRPDQYQAFVAGRSVGLTLREYHLIELLARADGGIQQRELIYEALWGREMERNERSVDVCIHKLRRKLELASPAWRYVHTHYGKGYRLEAERHPGGAERHPGGEVLELRSAHEPSETSLAA